MSGETVALATIFVLTIFVGFEVISKVPTTLHTPLMSGANAIHGIIVVGAMLVSAAIGGPLGLLLGFLAVVLGTANVVGGFVVTDRMLAMFKQRPTGAQSGGGAKRVAGAKTGATTGDGTTADKGRVA